MSKSRDFIKNVIGLGIAPAIENANADQAVENVFDNLFDEVTIMHIERYLAELRSAERNEVVTEEQIIEFIAFQDWERKNAPNLLKFRDPFTAGQLVKARAKVKRDMMKELLLQMHNRSAHKDNVSAYLTLLAWSRNSWNKS